MFIVFNAVELLSHYAKQLPDGFEMCSKVWEEITIPRFAKRHCTAMPPLAHQHSKLGNTFWAVHVTYGGIGDSNTHLANGLG
ncbi:hypothetical protein [Nitrospira sp. Nam74]